MTTHRTKKLSLVLTSAAWLLACPHAHAPDRIATIDLHQVFNDYWKKQEAETVLTRQAADLQKEAKRMLEELNRAKGEAQSLLASAKDEAAGPQERDRRQKAGEQKLNQVKEMEDQLLAFERQAKATMDEQTERVRTKLFKEITEVVRALAKDSGYTFVLNRAPDSDPITGLSSSFFVLYADSQDDLTGAISAQLKATAPAGSPSDSPAPSGTQSKPSKP